MRDGYSKMYEGLFDTRIIYLSDQESASNIELLKALNITAVLTVAKQIKLNYPETIVPQHLWLPAIDKPQYDIETLFDETFEFIDRVHQTRNVLIHCGVGVSRSASVFIAYLIKKHGYSYKTAFSLAKRRRPIINPNKGFIKALQRYSEKYSDKRAMSKEDDRIRLANKLNRRGIKKKMSMRQDEIKEPEIHMKKEQSTKESELKNQIQDIDNLNRILQQKQRIEQKLKQLQSYYHSRAHKDRYLAKFNSCFHATKEPVQQTFIQEFAKNSSSQL